MQIPKNDPVRLLRQSCTAPFCWGTCLSRTVSRTRLTAMRFHAILCYSEGRNSRENAMSFRFFPWTKVSLILQGLRTFSADFGDKKNPAGLRRSVQKSDPFRKPASGFSCPKGCEGRYCMQSIPLAVLKRKRPFVNDEIISNCMQSIPLAVLKPWKECHQSKSRQIVCNPYRLRC